MGLIKLVSFLIKRYAPLIRPIWQATAFGVQCTRLTPEKEKRTAWQRNLNREPW